MKNKLLLITFLLATANAFANPVLQSDGSFLITAVPVVINNSGNYLLRRGIYAGNGNTTLSIWIKAENVVLDLNQAILDNNPQSPNNPGNSTAIVANGKNTVIKNGIIRNYTKGISYSYSDPQGRGDRDLISSVVIENNFISHCKAYGITVSGNGAIVKNNKIVGTSEYGTGGGFPFAYDIYVSGASNTIEANTFVNRSGSPHLVAVGFAQSFSDSDRYKNNLVVGNSINGHSRGLGSVFNNYAWGYYKNNTIVNVGHAVTGGIDTN